MNVRIMCAAAGLAGAAVLVGQMKVNAFGGPDDGSVSDSRLNLRDAKDSAPLEQGLPKPDVTVCDIPGVSSWGILGGIRAYSFGTTSLNVGDDELDWFDNSPFHPVISQNIFRLKDGRFEHIGQAWLKHGFCALQGNCGGPGCIPAGGGCFVRLGVGCSDPYGSFLNGQQGGMGPKSEVNAASGAFAWPYGAFNQTGNAIYKRLQVRDTDLQAAMNPGALYFVEAQYIAADDAQAGAGNNNASYRQISFNGTSFSMLGTTMQEKTGIEAWQANGLGAGIPDPGVTLVNISAPDGRFILGYKISDLGGGQWHYEYALYNMNSDRSGQAFRVPVPAGVNVTNIGFHDVDYHSGEPYAGTDWTVSFPFGEIRWASETETQNVNANALRWGTLYNFRFDADSAPTTADLVIDLFKPGSPSSSTVSAQGPGPVPVCPTDINGDGVTNVLDLIDLLLCFGQPAVPVCEAEDVNGDTTVNVLDLIDLLLEFGNPCP